MKAEVDRIKEERRVLGYVPAPPLIPIWEAFWEIKGTCESAIRHVDILAYQTLMRWEFSIQEVRQLLTWDRMLRNASNKHNR